MLRVGSRAQVMHGNAKMTSGGLTKKHITYIKTSYYTLCNKQFFSKYRLYRCT